MKLMDLNLLKLHSRKIRKGIYFDFFYIRVEISNDCEFQIGLNFASDGSYGETSLRFWFYLTPLAIDFEISI